MTAGLRKHLKQLPWFLLYNYPKKLATYEKLRRKNKLLDPKDKVRLNAYRSPSPMNELCDYINTWEKKCVTWDNSVIDTTCLILDNTLELNDKNIIKTIRHIINDFSVDLKNILENCENNEDDGLVDILIDKYKDKLSAIVQDNNLLANYVIKVSYLNTSISKQLAWMGYGDYIIDNLKKNSPKSKRVSIIETPYNTDKAHEYLGKYYLLEEDGVYV